MSHGAEHKTYWFILVGMSHGALINRTCFPRFSFCHYAVFFTLNQIRSELEGEDVT